MVLGALGSHLLLVWRGTFAGFLALGRPARWEPAEILPTLYALRKLTFDLLGPVGVMMARGGGGGAGRGCLADRRGELSCRGGGLQAGSHQSRLEYQEPLLAARRGAAGQVLIPAAVLAVFAVQRIARQMTLPPFSTTRLEMLGTDVYGLLVAAAWLLFAWSLIDYLVEWQSRETRLKMSREDMRDEFKETEGNPQIRGRIRNLQRQARRRKVKNDVSKAAVVLTNPTHYAVALSFDFATMEAPKVLAKGRNDSAPGRAMQEKIQNTSLGQRLGGPGTCAEPDRAHCRAAFRARQKAGQGQAQPPDDPLVRGWRSARRLLPTPLDAKCVLAADRRALTVSCPPRPNRRSRSVCGNSKRTTHWRWRILKS